MGPMRRVELEPLLAVVASMEDAPPKSHEQAAIHGRLVTDSHAARTLGVDRVQINYWRRTGGIPWVSADRLAGRLGRHPLDIWPAWPGEVPTASPSLPTDRLGDGGECGPQHPPAGGP